MDNARSKSTPQAETLGQKAPDGSAGPGAGEVKVASKRRKSKARVWQEYFPAHGTNPAYLRARLQRDRPEFAARLAQGEFNSVRQAAIVAGILKVEPRLSISRDPAKAAKLIKAHFTEDELHRLLAALGEQTIRFSES